MDITNICVWATTLLCILMCTFVVPLIKSKYGQAVIDEALSTASEIYYWVEVFVRAAEQIYPEVGTGEQRKEYVLNLIQEKIEELGLTVDMNAVDAQIEAAVFELHQSLK